MSRCYTESDVSYPNYGGRGIKVCDRWHEYKNFLADMGERLNGLSIHRINNDGDYCRNNCIWATSQQQILSRGQREIGLASQGVNKQLAID